MVSVPHELRAGDEIYVGKTTLRFRDAAQREVPAPRAERKQEIASADQLVVRDGRGIGLQFKLEGKKLTVGRNPDSDIWLEDSSVSWDHARLEKKTGGWHITDLGSTNGTHIDGERLPARKAAALQSDVELIVGRVAMGFAGERPGPAKTEMLQRQDAPAQRLCAHCGEPLKDTSKFCPTCGQPVGSGEAAVGPVVLRISGGDEEEQAITLEETVMIGRDAQSCQVVLKTGAVSGRHLEIERREDGYYARDLGSTNGTALNGEPLGEEAVKLGPDDELILGKKVTLIFQEKD
jgi:pSer/pThr/pTyr-binding forkhead associated (FHA) protein